MNKYNDVFHEDIVVRKNRSAYNAVYFILNILMYFLIVLTIIGFQGIFQSLGNSQALISSILWFIGFGGLTALIFFYKDNLKTDFEYAYTNGILDIARVKNNKTRKELLSINTKEELELIAPIMTNDFNRYQSMSDVKKVNAWLNRDIKKYFAVIRKDNQKIMLIFEPSEKFIAVLKKYNPQKVKTQ